MVRDNVHKLREPVNTRGGAVMLHATRKLPHLQARGLSNSKCYCHLLGGHSNVKVRDDFIELVYKHRKNIYTHTHAHYII